MALSQATEVAEAHRKARNAIIQKHPQTAQNLGYKVVPSKGMVDNLGEYKTVK